MLDDLTRVTTFLTICLIIGVVCLGPINPAKAQSTEWREENIGVPDVRGVASINGEAFVSTYRGLYRFDDAAGVWRFTNAETRAFDLQSSSIQPGGVLTMQSGNGTLRFVASENTVERRPITYHVEANDSIVGVVSYSGSDPNVVRVTWRSWTSPTTVQVDSATLNDRSGGSFKPCADGSLFFVTDSMIVSFKHGRSPRITRFRSSEAVDEFNSCLFESTTNIIMMSADKVIASSDHGETWRTILTGSLKNSYTQFQPTHDPNVFYAVVLHRKHIRITGAGSDTLETVNYVTADGAAGPFGWMCYTRSRILHAAPTSREFVRAEQGLPSAGIWFAHNLPGGIAAMSEGGVTVRPTNSTWTFPFGDNVHPDVSDVAGGTSIDDIWIMYYTGWEQGAFARSDRNGELRAKRDVRLVNFRSAVYWDQGDSAFCFSRGEAIFLYGAQNNHWLVQQDASIIALVPFIGRRVVGISRNGTAWQSTGGLTDWRSMSIPKIPDNAVRFGRPATVAGASAIVQCDDHVLLTQDYGSSWQLIVLKQTEVMSISRSGTVYRGIFDASRGGYHFTATRDGRTRSLAFMPVDSTELRLAMLNGVQVDEEESRLFAYSASWVRSTTVSPVSSVHEVGDQHDIDLHAPVEIFDLCGRSVGSDLTSSALPTGAYLVMQQGVTRCMMLPLIEH